MKRAAKKLITGTPLEGIARKAYRTFRPPEVSSYDIQASHIMARVLDRRSDCIDVGCHVGSILDLMLSFAPEGTHYAFEPLPDLYRDLRRKYAGLSNVRLYELALADRSGHSTFQHVVSRPGFSGLRRRHYAREEEEVLEITVTVAKLDDIVPDEAEIRFVKIDVEGGELQVLSGSTAVLRRCRPFVVFEHGKGGADYYGTTPEQVFDLLAACNLRVSLMRDWLDVGDAKAFTRSKFADEFDSGRNFYYLAHP